MNLVINSYGVSLNLENGLFVISSPEGKQSFPPDVIKTISIGKATRITSDVVLAAIKHQVEILFINGMGQPEGRIWSVQYGSISNIRKAQVDFLYSPAVVAWVKQIILNKLDGQVALLLAFQPEKNENLKIFNRFKSAINSIEDYKRKIELSDGEYISDIAPSLRGWEGAGSRKYFQTLTLMMPSDYQFSSRNRRPAQDPFNAMLNYAYGMLYGKVEGALIKAGLDPYIGIFHRDDYNRPALVFDVIENYRVWMDYVVYQLCTAEAIPIEAFEYKEESGMLLLPLAKRILIQSVHDYLDEIIAISGKKMSRLSHLEADAVRLAQTFLKESNHDVNR